MIPNYPAGKDLISAADVSRDDLDDVLARAASLMRGGRGASEAGGQRRVIGNLFFQRSTRTKLGFQVAALKLGHNALDAYDPERNRVGSANGDSFEDHIRTIAEFTDLLVVRHSDELACKDVSRIAHVPVINAGNGAEEHPTQALIDLFCMIEMRGPVAGQKLAICCDSQARYAYSLLLLLEKMPPAKLTFCVDPDQPFAENTSAALTRLARLGVEIDIVHDIEDCLDHDVLNLQTQDLTSKVKSRLGEGDLKSHAERDAFTLTADKVLRAKSDIIILNPLPRQGELDPSCDALPNARYFDQVKLSTYMRMAVLDRMLCGTPWTGRIVPRTVVAPGVVWRAREAVGAGASV
ncbi:MAG: aspartate/ornithine carbamoyltransferase family protein [Beijerinckiaceae bacterium]